MFVSKKCQIKYGLADKWNVVPLKLRITMAGVHQCKFMRNIKIVFWHHLTKANVWLFGIQNFFHCTENVISYQLKSQFISIFYSIIDISQNVFISDPYGQRFYCPNCYICVLQRGLHFPLAGPLINHPHTSIELLSRIHHNTSSVV